jgi:hypothetical protein
MVKSLPGAEHADMLDFLKEAEFVAFQGESLAHLISDWVKKAKKQFIEVEISRSDRRGTGESDVRPLNDGK